MTASGHALITPGVMLAVVVPSFMVLTTIHLALWYVRPRASTSWHALELTSARDWVDSGLLLSGAGLVGIVVFTLIVLGRWWL